MAESCFIKRLACTMGVVNRIACLITRAALDETRWVSRVAAIVPGFFLLAWQSVGGA